MVEKDTMETRPLTDDVESLNSDDQFTSHELEDGQHFSRSKGRQCRWLILAALAVITNLLSGLGGVFLGQRTQDLDSKCAAHTSQYSPVIKDIKIKYAPTNFNGSFMKQDVYRLPGSPEVDAAWDALGVNYRAGVIPEEEGLRSGLTPAHVQRAEKYGGGFFVNVEGLHHLHCLDLVRKSLYYNYPYYKALGKHAFQNDDDILQLHVSHCLDTVRQVLMCNADTGVLGQVWYNKASPEAFPDFKTTHTCKNYDTIRQWAEDHQEPEPDTLPPGYMKLPRPDDVLPVTP